MKSKIIIFLIFSIAVTSSVFSQGGSNYSIFGIGDVDISPSSAYDGLASTSIAFPMEHAVNVLNPAILSKSTKTRLLTGYRFNQNLIEDINSNTLFQNNGSLSGVSAIFVIDTSMGITASFGFNPYSSVNYLIESPIDVEFEGINLTGISKFQGDGGISLAYLGASTNITDNLSVGANVFATFGIVKSSITSLFNDYNHLSSLSEHKSKFSGYGFKLGALYEPIENLLVGAYTEIHSSLEYEDSIIYKSSWTTDDISFVYNKNLSLPNSFGIGISYLTGKFRIGGDIKMYMLSDINYNKSETTEFRNLNVYSLAVSRLGNTSLSANYFDKVTYNFGLGYKQLYYKLNNVDIDEMFLSIGMNMPLTGTAMIDASFTMGSRGTKTEKLVQEYFGRLSIDISIGETWFKPFKREY